MILTKEECLDMVDQNDESHMPMSTNAGWHYNPSDKMKKIFDSSLQAVLSDTVPSITQKLVPECAAIALANTE